MDEESKYRDVINLAQESGFGVRKPEGAQITDGAWERFKAMKESDPFYLLFQPYEDGTPLVSEAGVVLTHPSNRVGRIIPVYGEENRSVLKQLGGVEIKPAGGGEIVAYRFVEGSWVEPEAKKSSDRLTSHDLVDTVSQAYKEITSQDLNRDDLIAWMLDHQDVMNRSPELSSKLTVLMGAVLPEGSNIEELKMKYAPKERARREGVVMEIKSSEGNLVKIGVAQGEMPDGQPCYRVCAFGTDGEDVDSKNTVDLVKSDNDKNIVINF